MYFTSVFCTNSQELTRPELSAWKEISHDRKPSSLLEFYSFKSKRLLKCNLRENACSQLQRKRKKGTSSKGMALNSTSGLDLWVRFPVFYFLYLRRKGVQRCRTVKEIPFKNFLISELSKRQGLFY